MRLHTRDAVEIVEIRRDDISVSPLRGRYVTDSYYELSITRKPDAWRVKLYLKPLEKLQEKVYQGRLFEEQVEEPRAFAAVVNEQQVGWIELGYQKWNNRMRVWEFFVHEEFRRKGIGTRLMKHAVQIAKQKGARMIVLETQSCDVPAIKFYIKQRFDLVGFDLAAYSNDDISRKEVRLEFGLRL